MSAKFHLQHKFAVSANRLTQLLTDPEFMEALARHFGAIEAGVEVAEQNDERIYLRQQLTEPDKKSGGEQRAIMHWEWDKKALHAKWWREDLDRGKLVAVGGEVQITASGSDGCLYGEEGEINIAIPLLGNKIAQKICNALEKRWPTRAAFIEESFQEQTIQESV